MASWNPQQYIKFLKERTQPAQDLANRLIGDNPKRILDIGCGPGNSTNVLASQFPNAYILGIDSSAEMVEKAKQSYPSLEFRVMDATNLEALGNDFDIVFSNACIQWISNHRALINHFMGLLRPGGKLAIQIPDQQKQIVYTLINRQIMEEKWATLLKKCDRTYNNLQINEYHNILSECSSDFSIWETTYMHRMPSNEAIVEWYKGTGIKPYLDLLDDSRKVEFCQDFLIKLNAIFRQEENAEVIFPFPRIFLLATK